MKVTVLGSGASKGVPMANGYWGTCNPNNPKNRRTRASILLEHEGQTILVDTCPDFRDQALRAGLTNIDALIYTHPHSDHTHGIDDLLPFCWTKNATIPTYGEAFTFEVLRERFSYCFGPNNLGNGVKGPMIEPRLVERNDTITWGNLSIRTFQQQHGGMMTLGLRIGNFAYSTDVSHLDDEALEALKGIKTWIVGCVQREPVGAHAGLEQHMAWAKQIGAEQVYISHMSVDTDYDSLCADYPQWLRPSYDGMVLDLDIYS